MNKIFKIVFNATRGKMIVVNEATSSVQTGKKAAVTVAVMAALVGGTAQADMAINGEGYLGGRYIGEGQLVITDQTISGVSAALYAGKDGDSVGSATATVTNSTFETSLGNANWAIYGGSRSDSANITDGETEVTISNSGGFLDVFGGGCKNSAGTFTSSLSKVTADNVKLSGTGGNADLLYRGHIFGAGYLSAADATMTFEKTEVNVNNVFGSVLISGEDDNPGSTVLGGGRLFITSNNASRLIVKDATVVVDGEKTSLDAVYGGSMISGSENTGILETHKTHITIKNGYVQRVIGGNHINFYGGNASLGSSEISIKGGLVDLVVGGNYIEISGGTGDGINATRTATADSTSINVLGGTVGTVVGGGYSLNANSNQDLNGYDVNLNSSVKSTSVSISNAEVTGDVIGGGLSVGSGTSASASDKVGVVVENSTVAGVITTDDMTDEGIKETNATGKVEMFLTNVEAAKVQASKGSVEIQATKDGKSSIGELAVADDVQVALKADGYSNDVANGDIFVAVGVNSEDVADVKKVTVAMEEGMTEGAVTGSIEKGVAKVTQATNSIMSNTLDLASAAPLAMNRLLMNDVRKRMGDLRSAEGTHGVWARYDGGKLSGANSLENDFTTIQVGIDTVPVADAPRFGVAFAYTTSDADMKRGGAEMDAYSLAFYGTKMYDNGMFVDVIGRMATADTDVTVDGNKKGTMDNVALSLSGEFGWRFDVTDSFFVEPQAELTYTYVNADTLTLSEGTSYEFDSVDSLMGRVGFVAGFKCPADFGNVYVRASAVHEFLGDAAVRGGSSIHEIDGEDTWVEYGIGANFNINKNTYVYADIERTEGAALEEDWRANVGVRYSF